jgi:hypothetical protein
VSVSAHDRHDPLLIAASLDSEASDDDRSAAAALEANCPDCATLHADLLTLRAETRALAPARRIRDFRLTADDAARLRASAAGEPQGATARLIGDMHDSSVDHGAHDLLLIASSLDRSVEDPERERAATLIASCDECAALHADLVALREATRALPTPARARDYRLSPADAERLHQTGWRRMLAAIGSSRDLFSRPLAVGLTTIGLAGLLVAAIPGILSGQTGASTAAPALSAAGQAVGGGAAGAANPESVGDSGSSKAAPPVAPTAAPSFAAAQLAPTAASPGAVAPAPAAAPSGPEPSAGTYDAQVASPAASSAANAQAPESTAPDVGSGGDSTRLATNTTNVSGEPSGLAIMAAVLLITGLLLFALRWTARRLAKA